MGLNRNDGEPLGANLFFFTTDLRSRFFSAVSGSTIQPRLPLSDPKGGLQVTFSYFFCVSTGGIKRRWGYLTFVGIGTLASIFFKSHPRVDFSIAHHSTPLKTHKETHTAPLSFWCELSIEPPYRPIGAPGVELRPGETT